MIVDIAIEIAVIATSSPIWELTSLLSDIFAPLVTAVIGLIVWLHRRVTLLEESKIRHTNSLYGTESDQLQRGVIREVKKVDGRIEKQQERLRQIEDELEKLEDN